MNDRKRVLLLSILIMTFVALAVGAISLFGLYRTAFEQQRDRLVETVRSRARLIEAVARFDATHSAIDVAGGAEAATLSQVVRAHEQFRGFGQTGEFTLARREGEMIVFLLRHRHSDLNNPRPVPFNSELAEPMRRALSGQSGTVIGLDYRGERVLAAYEPIGMVNWGVVGKIDLAEIRGVFVRAGVIALAVAVVVILGGAFLFLRTTDPLIKRLEQSEARLKEAQRVAHMGSWDWNIATGELQWSDETYRVFGLGPSQFEPTYEAFLSLVHPEDRESVQEHVNAALRSNAEYGVDHRIVLPSGSVRNVHEQGEIDRDLSGAPTRMVGTVIDITERKRAEEELREAEQRYRTLFEQSPDAIVVVDAATTQMVQFNDLAPRLLGYTPEEFAQVRISDVQALESPEETSAHIEKILREGGDDFETKLRTKQGQVRYARVSVRAVELSGQTVLHCTLSDITDRKRAEEALGLDEARLEALVKLNDMAETPLEVVADFALEEAVRVTRSQTGFLGFMTDDESQMNIHAWSANAMRECAVADKPITFSVAEAGLWGDIVRQRKPILVNDYAALGTRKNGYPQGHVPISRFLGIPVFEGERIVAVAAVANKDDEYQDGDVRQLTLLMAGMWRHIQRQRDEAALRDSRAFLQTVIDGVPDAVMVIDRDFRIVLANRTVRELSGGLDPGASGLTCYRVSHHRDTPCPEDVCPCPLRQVISSKSPVVAMHSHFDAKGNELLLEIIAAPIFDETGEVIQVIEACRDVTDRVRAEEQARQRQAELAHVSRLSTMGEMATSLAHELNQPLSAIVNYLQACLENIRSGRGDRKRFMDSLSRAAVQAERAGRIIENLRDFVRKGEACPSAVDVNTLVREATDLLNPEARKRDVQMELALTDALPPVKAEPIQIQQVIVNLIRNGMEAMVDGGVDRRRLSIRTGAAEDGFVEVAVHDTGPGLPPDGEQKVFDAFFTTKSNGMGMGLSIGRSIIEAHGGRMWAADNLDGGAMFCFTLPSVQGGREDNV